MRAPMPEPLLETTPATVSVCALATSIVAGPAPLLGPKMTPRAAGRVKVPVALSVPLVIVRAPDEPRLDAADTRRAPALIWTPPVLVLAPERMSVPVPSLT